MKSSGREVPTSYENILYTPGGHFTVLQRKLPSKQHVRGILICFKPSTFPSPDKFAKKLNKLETSSRNFYFDRSAISSSQNITKADFCTYIESRFHYDVPLRAAL